MGHRFPQHLHALTASGMVLCEDVGHSNPQKLRPLKAAFCFLRLRGGVSFANMALTERKRPPNGGGLKVWGSVGTR